MANLHQLLKAMVDRGASDLHITTGSPPQLRIDGDLGAAEDERRSRRSRRSSSAIRFSPTLRSTSSKKTMSSTLSFGVKGLSRFPQRTSFMQRGAVAGAFRTIPFKILTFAGAGSCRPSCTELSKKPRGLVLVTGPTGSGKSTTLASIIDKINTDRHEHIMTIEDPIEYPAPSQELPRESARGRC